MRAIERTLPATAARLASRPRVGGVECARRHGSVDGHREHLGRTPDLAVALFDARARIVDAVDQDPVVVVDLLAHVAPGVPEVVEAACPLKRVRQVGDRIEQELPGVAVHVECQARVQCAVQHLRLLIAQLSGVVGGEQQAHGLLLQPFFQDGSGVARQCLALLAPAVIASLRCHHQRGGGIGGVGAAGLWPGQRLLAAYACASEVQPLVVTLVRSQERLLPIGLLHQQRVSEALPLDMRHGLQTGTTAHRIKGRIQAGARGTCFAARCAAGRCRRYGEQGSQGDDESGRVSGQGGHGRSGSEEGADASAWSAGWPVASVMP